MGQNLLLNIFIFLAAASIMVPIASRFKLGSVIGYLLVGIFIGPYGLKLRKHTSACHYSYSHLDWYYSWL